MEGHGDEGAWRRRPSITPSPFFPRTPTKHSRPLTAPGGGGTTSGKHVTNLIQTQIQTQTQTQIQIQIQTQIQIQESGSQ
ncbi:hypothetical protein EYF80_045689 [Liparis tanakae]|uniref:Uncharacterized protein n=1 Tax=Liparis tanakae TaxID=230148 RepID=A0A4Z2FUU7_9TELE|nr:hypothetical protein EYF80_045689 [Liparis tanakae]